MQAWDVQEPRARQTDPETSHEAARSVRNVGPVHKAILKLFLHADLSDDELVAWYQFDKLLPKASDSGIRTRRAELARMGKLAEVGVKKLASGRNGRVWALPKEGE